MEIRQDIMTPNERLEAFGKNRPIDRVVCVPMVASSAAHLIGRTIKEFQLDPKVLAYSLIEAYKRYRYDSVGVCTNCSIMAEAMGAKLKYHEDDVASCDEPILKNKEDISKIKIATPEDGTLWVFYKAAEICLKEIGHEITPSIAVAGPFTTAATLRGVEAFARDVYKDPKFCHKILRMSTESIKNHIRAIVKTGAAVGTIADPIASGSLISAKTFEKFAFPYIKELVDFTHDLGSSIGLHICGKSTRILKLMVDTGADLISIDDVDLEFAKTVVAGKAILVGNISTTDEMLFGPVERIKESCIKALDIMRDYDGKYILATSCDLSPVTPWEHIDAMMDVARSYGAYDYKK
jgi:uroporphyrinogen decarboxylase